MLSVGKPTSLVQQKKQQWARERGAYRCGARAAGPGAGASSRCITLLTVLQRIHGRDFVKVFYGHSRLRDTLVGICMTRVFLTLERIF